MPILKKEHGQSLVEFALVLPILLVLVFSIVDFGMLFQAKNQLEITGFAAARTISLGNPVPLGVTVNPAGGYTVGQQVTVTATTSYTALTPILYIFFGTNVIPLTNKTTIVIEQASPT
jgi:hypothetical protein